MSGYEQMLSSLSDKNGAMVLPVIEDMRQRAGSLLIVNLAADDDFSPISAYIAEKHADLAALGIAFLSEICACEDIIIYCGVVDAERIIAEITAQSTAAITVFSGSASPVLRDETALYSAIDAGVIRVNRAELDYCRDFRSYGYHGRPTLVIDAETAYQTGRLCKDPDVAATKLISVINGGTLIMEVETGTSASEFLTNYEISDLVLVGGTCGRLVYSEMLKDMRISFLYEFDSMRIFSRKECVVGELAKLYENIKGISCTKCVMCREGSWQLSAIISDITKGRANRNDIALIEDVCPIIRAGSLCSFGKGMVSPALSATVVSREEMEKHVMSRSCSAGQCVGLIKYIIDPSLCTGCGECIDSCQEGAIEGKDGFIHIIDNKLCEMCGDCVNACPIQAIKADSGNIRTPKKPVKAGRFNQM